MFIGINVQKFALIFHFSILNDHYLIVGKNFMKEQLVPLLVFLPGLHQDLSASPRGSCLVYTAENIFSVRSLAYIH